MKKFLGTLIKASFFSWVALFMLINPVVMLVFGSLNGLNVLQTSGTFAAVMVYGLTAILFASFWVKAYAGSWSEALHSLRMKRMLRGVGKD